MKDIKKILFVCTGNSCRSIMAEVYAKKRFKEEKLPIEVKSAGTMGVNGMLPTEETLKVIEDEGIKGDHYKSTGLDEELLEWADLVLVMEQHHKEHSLGLLPEANNKVLYLGEFKEKDEIGDVAIADPIGRPLAFYRVSFNIIKKRIEGLIKWLKE